MHNEKKTIQQNTLIHKLGYTYLATQSISVTTASATLLLTSRVKVYTYSAISLSFLHRNTYVHGFYIQLNRSDKRLTRQQMTKAYAH